MDNKIFNAKKITAYFLWEYTGYDNAFHLWQCAESIINWFACQKNVANIIALPKENFAYINFMRNIAFRIFIFTNNPNDKFNWYAAEKLMFNGECLNAILKSQA